MLREVIGRDLPTSDSVAVFAIDESVLKRDHEAGSRTEGGGYRRVRGNWSLTIQDKPAPSLLYPTSHHFHFSSSPTPTHA